MSETNNALSQDLANAVHGDLQAFARLQSRTHEELQQARDSMVELVVSVQDVRSVLVQLLEHGILPEQAQSWAFFIRHGYIGYWESRPITDEVRRDFKRPGARLLAVHHAVPSGHSGPIRPIDIEYDLVAEDSIADTIVRLDDIDTEIDGEITDVEISELLRNLSHASEEGRRP
jgi:hypothetical protein